MISRIAWRSGVAAILLLAATHAFADEDGITPNSILLGRSAGITGAQAGPVQENGAGAQLYFDAVNRRGGVFGRKIILKTLDDGYEPKRTVANVKELITKDKVFALFLMRGTANNEAAIPVFTAAKVPNFAPLSPATSMSEPFQKYIFNVRARSSTEIEKIIQEMITLDIKRIGIAYAQDGLGQDVLAGTDKALKKYNLTSVAKVSFPRTATRFDEQIKQLVAAEPQAVIVGAVSKPAAAFILAMKKAGVAAQIFVLSNASSQTFINDLGDAGRGVGVTQVVPFPWGADTAVAREFVEAVKEHPIVAVTHGSLEGYISAKVLVEGLLRAGPHPTREKLISGLESMKNVDIGGMKISYSPENHQGSNFVELTVIGKGGKFMR